MELDARIAARRRRDGRVEIVRRGPSRDDESCFRIVEPAELPDETVDVLVRRDPADEDGRPLVLPDPERSSSLAPADLVRVAADVVAVRGHGDRAAPQGRVALRRCERAALAEGDQAVDSPGEPAKQAPLQSRSPPCVPLEVVDGPDDPRPAKARPGDEQAEDGDPQGHHVAVGDPVGPVDVPHVVAAGQQPSRRELVDLGPPAFDGAVEERVVRVAGVRSERWPGEDAHWHGPPSESR